MNKVLAITGIRSEYDILTPVLRALQRSNGFDVALVVSGAHLSDQHGFTLSRIERDGFRVVDRIDNLLMTNRVVQRAKGAGLLTYAISQTIEREQPDFLLYVGDREEGIAAAIAATYMDVLFCHLGGGDTVFGNSDDAVRFAMSKLAHVHFAFAQQYADNLLKIGEEPFRVFSVGNPSLDNIAATPDLPLQAVSKQLGFDLAPDRYFVILQHPLSSEVERAYEQMTTALDAVEAFCAAHCYRAVGIHPNTDPGSFDILRAVERRAGSPHVRFFKTLPHELFVNLLRHSRALAGNSSLGFLEAPFYRLPVVNIGNRQRGRLNAGNVEFVACEQRPIRAALERACLDDAYRRSVRALSNPFGDGFSAQRIVDILTSIDSKDRTWHIKRKLC